MEIRFDVPASLAFLYPLLERFGQWIVVCRGLWQDAIDALSVLTSTLGQLWSIPRNAYLPIFAALFFFWPVLLSLVMALAAAWTWIFWLLTGVVFGLLQLLYVTYQFVMIAWDILALSLLKTYSMMRSQVLYYLDKSGSTTHRRTSRRRQWRQALEAAEGSYENFLKIRILPKDEQKVLASASAGQQHKRRNSEPLDAALPAATTMHRSNSFHDGQDLSSDSPTKKLLLPRNRSFSGSVDDITLAKQSAPPVTVVELGDKTTDLLIATTLRLHEARRAAELEPANETEAKSALQYLLSGVIKRNHLSLDDLMVQNARSVAESGQYGLTAPTRTLIRNYYEEVEKGLEWIAEAPLAEQTPAEADGFALEPKPAAEFTDRITLVRKMKQNVGRTALMLSGGGAQAMYHLGVIRAMIESKVYQDMKVISGTSGGSITAAMCAIKTPAELYADVCVPTVSTDYMHTGEMKKQNIRWFPKVMDMATFWLKNKLLVDSGEFRRTCDFYFSDITFEEAFERTGKHVCITVSASRASGGTAQRLLLNHISTPHVTLSSAVAASCALPGVMAPAKLMAKNSNGALEPFEVDGVEWIDGSVQADLPFQRIATLFAVTSFIVSQTNFHVIPFLHKAHHPHQKSVYWRLFQILEWDVRNRALKLSRLGLFPRMFGQDISKVFKQKYHGNLTIVPRFTTMQTFGLKALVHPTVKDMEGYLKYGQIATWPYLNAIRETIRLEKALDDCLARLDERCRTLLPEVDWSNHNDDIESIASSSVIASGSGSRVRIIGRPPLGVRDRDSERMRQKVSRLEQENQSLREQLEQMRQMVSADKHNTCSDGDSKESRNETNEGRTSLSDGSEGAVWNLVLSNKKDM